MTSGVSLEIMFVKDIFDGSSYNSQVFTGLLLRFTV